MANGEVKNYYVVTIIGSNRSVVIPDCWIRARVGGAILFYLPPQDHDTLAQIGGPFSISWSSKYGQIEQGFDNFLEASNYVNNTPTPASPEIRNSEREAARQINKNNIENKNLSELETLLRANTHLQLKPRTKQETSLKYSSHPETSLKESNELGALLRNSETPPAKTSPKPQPKPLLSKEPAEISQFGDRHQNIFTFNNSKVIESAVSAQLQPDSTKNPEQKKKKSLPDLVPIKSLKTMKMQTVVNPVQIARVAPMGTSAVKTSVIVRNKTADTKSDPVFQQPCVGNTNVSREFEEQGKQIEIQSKFDSTSEQSSSTRPVQFDPRDSNLIKMQVIGTQQMEIDNMMPAKSKKLTQNLTTVVDKTSPLYGISSDASEHLDRKESVDTVMHSSLNENCEYSTLTDISSKTNLTLFKIKLPILTKEKCNITGHQQLCGKSLKQNDEKSHQKCKDSSFTAIHNQNIYERTTKLMTTTEQASTAEISDVTPICSSLLMQKQVYSRSKINLLVSIRKNLENSLNLFENLKMLRSSMSVSVKNKLRIIKETREIIDKSLAKTSSKRRVIKPSPSIILHKSPKKIVEARPNSMDKEDKWTLKYKRQEKGTVELMANSHIYVNKKHLASCIKRACDYRQLGRLLLHEIFTEHALNKCSMTKGKTTRPGGYRRPGLNKAGIKALCDFVEKYRPTLKDGRLYRNWRPVARKLLKKSITNYMSNRRRY